MQWCKQDSLCNVRWDGSLLKAEAGGENERRVVLGEEEVDDVQKAESATVLVVLTN